MIDEIISSRQQTSNSNNSNNSNNSSNNYNGNSGSNGNYGSNGGSSNQKKEFVPREMDHAFILKVIFLSHVVTFFCTN